jgi:DNA-binding NtrC family response regulator
MAQQINEKSAVLIVEDDPVIRMVAADSLQEVGFPVYEASATDEAIRQLEHHREICVLFTDVNLEDGTDGLKLAWHVDARWPEVKIVVTTGRVILSHDDLPEGAIFLSKPYSLEALQKSVESASRPRRESFAG